MKAFTVNIKDLTDKKKNPKLSLSPRAIAKNKKIKKKGIKIIKEKSYTIIKSLDELKSLAEIGIEVAIILGGGGIKSTKFVDYNPKTKKFYVENYIDGSKEILTEKQLIKYTNIPEAIKKNALIISD